MMTLRKQSAIGHYAMIGGIPYTIASGMQHVVCVVKLHDRVISLSTKWYAFCKCIFVHGSSPLLNCMYSCTEYSWLLNCIPKQNIVPSSTTLFPQRK